MGRDDWENACASDNASSGDVVPRRSVSGPYRDDEAMLRARCERLERENAWLAYRLERAPTPAPRPPWAIAAPWLLVAVLGVLALSMTQRDLVVHRGVGVVRVSTDRFFVTRAWVERVVRAVPVMPDVFDGEIVGLRIAESTELTDAFGVRADDVVMAVDDHWIRDPDGARDAWSTARTAEHFAVTVRRRGVFRTIEVDVIE
jgi:hypothetical protein